MFARLSTLRGGRLAMELPDGTTRLFGDERRGEDVSLEVHDWRAFRRVLLGGETAAGVAYASGEWSSDDPVAVIRLMIANRQALGGGGRLPAIARSLLRMLRPDTVRRARTNAVRHYDLGNEFFEQFLDPTMTYSSAYFGSRHETLASAQRRKYAMLARKARISRDHRVLEIGCGWGGFAEFAAREIGCRVTAVTISPAQANYASERIRAAGLDDLVEVELADYRTLSGTFDRIVSIEMLEAVGHSGLDAWFGTCERLLAPRGLIAVQVITIPDDRYREYRRGSDFIRRHIFPGGHLPSLSALMGAKSGHSSFEIEHLENIAPHYAETLRRWRVRAGIHRDAIRGLGFDPDFVRRWEYYLAYCEAAFATRTLATLQIVLSRAGNPVLASEPYGVPGR